MIELHSCSCITHIGLIHKAQMGSIRGSLCKRQMGRIWVIWNSVIPPELHVGYRTHLGPICQPTYTHLVPSGSQIFYLLSIYGPLCQYTIRLLMKFHFALGVRVQTNDKGFNP